MSLLRTGLLAWGLQNGVPISGGLPVPQVASDTKAFPINRPLPPVRSAPSYDQAPETPFASLLDDSPQNVPDSPPPPAPTADDRASRADAPDRTAPPQAAKSDSKDGA